jgi:hypothetical protein
MSEYKFFEIKEDQTLSEIIKTPIKLEKEIQTLIDKNLFSLFRLTFLASEYSTGSIHKGRIDTLALDQNLAPVVIEYKRDSSECIINQAMYYMYWLMDHKSELQILVQKVLKNGHDNKIDWSTPRLFCIAAEFSKFDVHTAQVIQSLGMDVQLIKFTKHGMQINFEFINQSKESFKKISDIVKETSTPKIKEFKKENTSVGRLEDPSWPFYNLYQEVKNYIDTSKIDVEIKKTGRYIAIVRVFNLFVITGREDGLQLEFDYIEDIIKEIRLLLTSYPAGQFAEKPSIYKSNGIMCHLKVINSEDLPVVYTVIDKICSLV